jgi:hypothetical protein
VKKLEAEFDFIKGFKLKAIINEDDQIILEIIYLKKSRNGRIRKIKSSMACIHTSVNKISIEEYKEYLKEQDPSLVLDDKTVRERMVLSRDQAFIAHKGWVQEIAESGFDSFILLEDIEKSLSQYMYPISSFLINFILKNDLNLALEFVGYVKDRSIYEGTKSKSFIDVHFTALLNLLISVSHKDYKVIRSIQEDKNKRLLLAEMFKLNPSINVFTEKRSYLILCFEELKYYDKIEDLFELKNFYIIGHLLMNPLIHNEYKNFVNKCLETNYKYYHQTIAEYCTCPKEVKNFPKLFDSKSNGVRRSLLRNKSTYCMTEFNTLITDIDTDIVKHIILYEDIVSSKEVNLSIIFKDDRWSIIHCISKSELLAKYYPDDYVNFIDETIKKINAKPIDFEYYNVKSLLKNKEAVKLGNFGRLLEICYKESDQFEFFALNENAKLFPDFFSIAINLKLKNLKRLWRSDIEKFITSAVIKYDNFSKILHFYDSEIRKKAINLLRKNGNFRKTMKDKIYWYRNKKKRWVKGVGGIDIPINVKIKSTGYIQK